MKNLILSALIVLCGYSLNAQETYTINGTSYELKTEVNGTIDLLWNVIDGEYRYFVKKGTTIQELVNTKTENGDYNEEYLSTLKAVTSDATVSYDDVKLLLYSLKDFFNIYNYNSST